ncbi:MarR family winged helix-turn-helix transcriptional regulator [Pseudooceanicola sp. CBS1P-1]|uniref:MarR family transcriptional regulator n=2 Tax=Paracoccaceae TaxID=31989 RepID=A0A6L7G7F9_9RHOB|nr:MarR family winged helix-turn-helix transcriptional regulator [Pseudooceanicola endophyticus]MXN19955.1 MarR family transcriptional regulator [Pseudooceanicola albus]
MNGKPLPEFDLDGYLPYRLAVLATDLSKDLADQYRARFDISVAEWRVLVNVGYAGTPSVRDIERRVSLEKSKVSRAAARLEAAGYLAKCTDQADRRLVKLSLTPKGRALLTEIVPLAEAYQQQIRDMLGPHYQALQDALTTLMEKKNL